MRAYESADRRAARRIAAAACLVLLLPLHPLSAFDPPRDEAGPIAAQIEGPAVVEERGKALPLRLRLENRGDAPLEGTARIEVLEGWKVSPGEPRD